MAKKSTKRATAATSKSKPIKRSKPKPKAPKRKLANPRVIVGDHELARHYEVTSKTIYNWRLDGMPATELPGNRWQYDLDQTDAWVESRRTTGEGDEELRQIKRRTAEAKMRSAIAQAEDDERTNQIKEGNVLDREATELAIAEMNQAARDEILRVPTHFHSHLCKKCQPKALDELKKQLEHALTQLAKRSSELHNEDDD